MLKKINETMNVKMTVEDANYFNKLMERDEAKAVIEQEIEGASPIYLCPSCGELISKFVKGDFCPMCGQRVDRDNIAL